MSDSNDVEVVYDMQCPVCDFYCKRIDVADSAGRIVRIDARPDSEIMRKITGLGLDIDEGMVVRQGDQLYYGSDAIHQLALLSSGKGFVNFLARTTFRSRTLAYFLYPLFKFFRNMLLKLLGRTRINNLQAPGHDRF